MKRPINPSNAQAPMCDQVHEMSAQRHDRHSAGRRHVV